MAKETFNRNSSLNIGTTTRGSRKTTLTAAITKVLSDGYYKQNHLIKLIMPEEKERGITINTLTLSMKLLIVITLTLTVQVTRIT
jgi:translation elongation factor EF-Tu-like GTPase